MKTITRELKVYDHVFAKVDIVTGEVSDKIHYETFEKMGQREINSECSDTGRIFIGVTSKDVKYSVPVSVYAEVCTEYAKAVSDYGDEEDLMVMVIPRDLRYPSTDSGHTDDNNINKE